MQELYMTKSLPLTIRKRWKRILYLCYSI